MCQAIVIWVVGGGYHRMKRGLRRLWLQSRWVMDQFDIELDTSSVAKTLSTHVNCVAEKGHPNMAPIRDSGVNRCPIQIGPGGKSGVTLLRALFSNPIIANSSDPVDKHASIREIQCHPNTSKPNGSSRCCLILATFTKSLPSTDLISLASTRSPYSSPFANTADCTNNKRMEIWSYNRDSQRWGL